MFCQSCLPGYEIARKELDHNCEKNRFEDFQCKMELVNGSKRFANCQWNENGDVDETSRNNGVWIVLKNGTCEQSNRTCLTEFSSQLELQPIFTLGNSSNQQQFRIPTLSNQVYQIVIIGKYEKQAKRNDKDEDLFCYSLGETSFVTGSGAILSIFVNIQLITVFFGLFI